MGQYTQTQCSYCFTAAPWDAAQKVWFDRKERRNKGIHTPPLQRRPVGTDTTAGRVCLCVLMSVDKLWVASLLILAASQQDGERPATVPSARRPPPPAAFVLTKDDRPSHAGANPPRLRLWRPPGINDASRHRNSTTAEWFSWSACTPRYRSWNLRTLNIYAAMLQSRCVGKQEKLIRSVQDTSNVSGSTNKGWRNV